jgi:FKBP-type peptidyl-prolyl cis-trans isomerase (trigger factor)
MPLPRECRPLDDVTTFRKELKTVLIETMRKKSKRQLLANILGARKVKFRGGSIQRERLRMLKDQLNRNNQLARLKMEFERRQKRIDNLKKRIMALQAEVKDS